MKNLLFAFCLIALGGTLCSFTPNKIIIGDWTYDDGDPNCTTIIDPDTLETRYEGKCAYQPK